MMPLAEYRRVNRLPHREGDAELRAMNPILVDYSNDSYHNRLALVNRLAVEGRGPGAWHERFTHECAKAQGGSDGWQPATEREKADSRGVGRAARGTPEHGDQ